MRYFDRNHNENVDSEIGNENGLRNSCSDRSLYDLFRIISEEDFQEEKSAVLKRLIDKWNRRYR